MNFTMPISLAIMYLQMDVSKMLNGLENGLANGLEGTRVGQYTEFLVIPRYHFDID